MRNKPIIMIDTTNAPTYCRSHCCNGDCSKHISKGMAYTGPCKFALLKDTKECEGYISRRKKAAQEAKAEQNVTDSDTENKGKRGSL